MHKYKKKTEILKITDPTVMASSDNKWDYYQSIQKDCYMCSKKSKRK